MTIVSNPTVKPDLAALYDTDFYVWTQQTASLLRQGRFAEIDIEHLAEEIESMGKSDRRALESYLKNITLHLLKWHYQGGLRGPSWRKSINNGRDAAQRILEDSPSLAREIHTALIKVYPKARRDALDETGLPESTFPDVCPWTAEQILDETFWPD